MPIYIFIFLFLQCCLTKHFGTIELPHKLNLIIPHDVKMYLSPTVQQFICIFFDARNIRKYAAKITSENFDAYFDYCGDENKSGNISNHHICPLQTNKVDYACKITKGNGNVTAYHLFGVEGTNIHENIFL